MTEFKFRAECRPDVCNLIKELPCFESIDISIVSYKLPTGNLSSPPPTPIPDVVATLAVTPLLNETFDLDQLRNLISEIEDGHVMLETVELAENYTGERVSRHIIN